jgi:hypothetical protein
MANLYTIERLLQDKEYNSKTLSGTIITAEKSDHWYGSNRQAYKVLIRSDYSLNDQYRIVAVEISEGE